MERVYGGCLCYGPPIESGFYYDMFLENEWVSAVSVLIRAVYSGLKTENVDGYSDCQSSCTESATIASERYDLDLENSSHTPELQFNWWLSFVLDGYSFSSSQTTFSFDLYAFLSSGSRRVWQMLINSTTVLAKSFYANVLLASVFCKGLTPLNPKSTNVDCVSRLSESSCCSGWHVFTSLVFWTGAYRATTSHVWRTCARK